MKPSTVLVYGGSFDPVHFAHMDLLMAGLRKVRPDETFIFPTYISPLKRRHYASYRHRANMLKAALEDWNSDFNFNGYCPQIYVDEFERKMARKTYAYEILEEVKSRYSKKPKIFFLGGTDLIHGFSQWRRPKTIVRLCTFLVATRPGWPKPNRTTNLLPKIKWMKKNESNISSTEVRRNLAKDGMHANHPISSRVGDYIVEHELYGISTNHDLAIPTI